MRTILLKEPFRVANRLEQLGLAKEQLLDVVDAMVLARNSCTANDPPAAPGWSAWRDGTRRLREVFCPLGWEKDDADMISSISHKDKGVKIAVSNTDEATGVENQTPQNRSPKGSATDRVIYENQAIFTDIIESTTNVIPMSAPGLGEIGMVHWYLCVFCDGEIVRAELSCPAKCASGYFTGFYERIMLLTDHDENRGIAIRPDGPIEDSGFEVPVTRKKAQ